MLSLPSHNIMPALADRRLFPTPRLPLETWEEEVCMPSKYLRRGSLA